MLVGEPIADVFQANAEILCAVSSCADSLAAHKTLAKKAVGLRWFLLIFKQTVNNIHFAQSSDRTVETMDHFMCLEKDYNGNSTGEEVLCSAACWELAFEHGGEQMEVKEKKKKSHRELLLEQRNKKLHSSDGLDELN